MSALKTQVGGDHYKRLGHYQPWEVLAKWLTPEELQGFMKGTVIAYLARNKNGRQDIEKAAHTMQVFLELTKPKAPEIDPECKCYGIDPNQMDRGFICDKHSKK